MRTPRRSSRRSQRPRRRSQARRKHTTPTTSASLQLAFRALSQQQPPQPPISGEQVISDLWQRLDETSLAAFQFGGWLMGWKNEYVRKAGAAVSLLSLVRAFGKLDELING